MWSRSILEKVGHLWFPERYQDLQRLQLRMLERQHIGLAWPKQKPCLVGSGALNRLLSIRREYLGFELEDSKCFSVAELKPEIIWSTRLIFAKGEAEAHRLRILKVTSLVPDCLALIIQNSHVWGGLAVFSYSLLWLFCFLNRIASAGKKASFNYQTNWKPCYQALLCLIPSNWTSFFT